MSADFDFTFGKPADDGAGRWIHGSVVNEGRGYRFTADMMLRHSCTMLQCNRVWLDVDRPFHAKDFAAFLRFIARGKFGTASRMLELDFPGGLDPWTAGTIWDAMMVWVDPLNHNCPVLLKDLTSLGDQLEQVGKDELPRFALAKFTQRSRPAAIEKVRPTPAGDAK